MLLVFICTLHTAIVCFKERDAFLSKNNPRNFYQKIEFWTCQQKFYNCDINISDDFFCQWWNCTSKSKLKLLNRNCIILFHIGGILETYCCHSSKLATYLGCFLSF